MLFTALVFIPVALRYRGQAYIHEAAEAEPRCEKCGCSTVGNQSGICPECGSTVAASDRVAPA